MITYLEIKESDFNRIEGMWKELILFLQNRSRAFKEEYENKTFDKRMSPFYKKIEGGCSRLVVAVCDGVDIAYCLSSITSDLIGEIDSLYINDSYRGHGIGAYLIEDAFAFFDSHDTVDDIVMASEGNESVLKFYEKYGFEMRYYTLKRKK